MQACTSTVFDSSSFCCTQDMLNWIISFPPLSQLFLDDDNSLHEWTFRFGLDILAVPLGILCAVMLHRFPQINGWICSRSVGRNLMTTLSALTLVCTTCLYSDSLEHMLFSKREDCTVPLYPYRILPVVSRPRL